MTNNLLDLIVLDPLSANMKNTVMTQLLRRHFKIQEVHFVAGRLRTTDDQPVYIAARRAAHETAFKAAQLFMDKSPAINHFNQVWQRNTILLNLASFCWTAVNDIFVRIFVAEALMRESGQQDALLLIALPEHIDPVVFKNCSSTLKIEFYQEKSIRQFYGILWLLREKLRRCQWLLNVRWKNGCGDPVPDDDKPSLLLLHEDQISPDRSYRTQPHWHNPSDLLKYRTLILQTANASDEPGETAGKAEEQIVPVPLSAWCFLSDRNKNQHAVERKLTQDLRRCIWVFNKGERMAMFTLIRLFYTARNLAVFCRQKNVKAFMTCENYLPCANAMQLIADPLKIRTLSYQYSNMSHVSPFMLTTADIMFAFSPLYHERWSNAAVKPGRFVDVGYVFDGAFKNVKKRALSLREKMIRTGCQFIICFFDENAFDGKYELVTKNDLMQEIQFLLTQLIADSSLGLVIKNQFQWNAVQQFPEIGELRKKALATGRYVELSVGTKRNIVFPAEAALVADIVIGHAVGATAPLEAALAGVRTVLLNPYKMASSNDFLYQQVDIVYHSLAEILAAIADFRAGKPEKHALGDWGPIIASFDSFRDGNAGQRMKAVLDGIMSERVVAETEIDHSPRGKVTVNYC